MGLAAGVLLLGRAGPRTHAPWRRPAEALGRLCGLPSWCAASVAIALWSLVVALVGFSWDVAWHADLGRDKAPFTPPLSAGRLRIPWSALPMGIMAAGALVGFPLDDYWHAVYGIDVTSRRHRNDQCRQGRPAVTGDHPRRRRRAPAGHDLLGAGEPVQRARRRRPLPTVHVAGGRLVISPLRSVGGGRYAMDGAVPTGGSWKTIVFLEKGDVVAAVPVSFPTDPTYELAAIPAPVSAPRTSPFNPASRYLMRESHAGSALPAVLAYTALALIFVVWCVAVVGVGEAMRRRHTVRATLPGVLGG